MKRDAQIEAVITQRELLLRRQVTQNGSDLRTAAEQVGRLSTDDLEMLFFRQIHHARLGELIEFALDHAERDITQQSHQFQRIDRHRHTHRLDVQVVAEQHGNVVAPP